MDLASKVKMFTARVKSGSIKRMYTLAKDIHDACEGIDHLGTLVSARIAHDGKREPRLAGAEHGIHDMGGKVQRRDQIDVERTAVLLLEHHPRKPRRADGQSSPLMRDLMVLAVGAAQRAAREEDRPRTGITRDGRLLPEMEGAPGDHELARLAADPDVPRRTVDAASARAELAALVCREREVHRRPVKKAPRKGREVILVEMKGLEPSASALRTPRSPS